MSKFKIDNTNQYKCCDKCEWHECPNQPKIQNPLLDDPKNNEYIFQEMLKKFRPELYVLGNLLKETGIDYYILFKILRHLKAIAEGTKHGHIEIDIVDGTITYIRGIEQDKLMIKVIKENNDI